MPATGPLAAPRAAPGARGLRGRAHAPWATLWAALLVLACLSATVSAQTADGPPVSAARAARLFTVPAVVGQELGQAQAAMKAAGFETQLVPLDNQRGGRRIVARTDPVAGTRYGSTATRPAVRLFHRAETPPDDVQPPRQLMPNLTGLSCAEAQARLTPLKRKLESCVAGSRSGLAPPGRINRQAPPANSVLNSDSLPRGWTEPEAAGVPPVGPPVVPPAAPPVKPPVTPPVTPPQREVIVPRVIDMELPAAVSRIEQVGLRAVFNAAGVDRFHRVQAQSPPAGQRVRPRSEVRLTFAALYVVPDLQGRSCAQAQELVRGAGFRTLQCQVLAADGNAPPGRIHAQRPPANTVLSAVQPLQAWEQPALVAVPDVLGQPEAQAISRLSELKFRPLLSGPAASSGRRVAAQSPTGGTLLPPGREVALRLDLSVPPLLGLDCEGARARSRDHGFPSLLCEQRLARPNQALNRVFEQAPAAGTRLAAAQALTAVIAKPVQVPGVVGQALPNALSKLQQAGLKGQPDASDGDREVRTQAPAAGTDVAPGSSVRLGTQRFEPVPAVVGMALPEAQQRISQARLVARPDQTDRAASRKVDRQEPAAGTRAVVGQAVMLFTHVELPVPDVTKQRLAQATAALVQAGLGARPDNIKHAEDREVRAQLPAAGAMAAEKSEVTLTTVRLVKVPALTGISCQAAGQRAGAAGVTLAACPVQSWLPWVLGEPTVVAQSLASNATVDEGTAVTAQAQAPWWSAPALLSLVFSASGGLGWSARRPLKWLSRRLFGAPASLPPPPLHWRVAPDLAPALSLRQDSAGDGTDADADAREAHGAKQRPNIRWRVVPDDVMTSVRGVDNFAGVPDEHR